MKDKKNIANKRSISQIRPRPKELYKEKLELLERKGKRKRKYKYKQKRCKIPST